jgi:hypothetical protein
MVGMTVLVLRCVGVAFADQAALRDPSNQLISPGDRFETLPMQLKFGEHYALHTIEPAPRQLNRKPCR